MAQLKRTGRTATVPGVGRARHDVIHTVPDELVEQLLATGEWARITTAGSATQHVVETPEPQRLTEVPAPQATATPPVRRRSTTKSSKT